MSRRLITTGFVVAVALLVAVTYGGVVSASHAWGNYHWTKSSAAPVDLTLGTNFDVPDEWNTEFGIALADWNIPSGSYTKVLDLTQVPGATTPTRCKAATGTIEVCAASYGNRGWLGVAQISVSGDHIVKAIAKMNDFYFDYLPYSEPSNGWRQFVMCQEIGHDFGLGHVNETYDTPNTGSCMDYTNDPAGLSSLDNRHPNNHDYEELADIYAHIDSGGGGGGGGGGGCKGPAWKCGGQEPPPAFDMELPDVGQWGRLLGTSPDGGQSTFVQDFGNGYRVFTHVTWTMEVAEQMRGRR